MCAEKDQLATQESSWSPFSVIICSTAEHACAGRGHVTLAEQHSHAPATSRHFTDLSIRCQQALLSGIIVLENHSHESIKVHSCRAATTASQLSLLSRRHHNKNILHTPATRQSSASAATSHHQSPLTHRRVQTSAQTQCDVIMRIIHAAITLP